MYLIKRCLSSKIFETKMMAYNYFFFFIHNRIISTHKFSNIIIQVKQIGNKQNIYFLSHVSYVLTFIY